MVAIKNKSHLCARLDSIWTQKSTSMKKINDLYDDLKSINNLYSLQTPST